MDFNKDKINKFTESIHSSIKTFLNEECKVKERVLSIRDFIVYLNGQCSQISKFKNVESDIKKYLEMYDFNSGNNFEGVKHCCETLPAIEGKISTIISKAKILYKKPNRYGLELTMNNCADFARYCRDKMKMNEVDKALKKSDSLIQRLQQIIDDFKKEDSLLNEINQLLQKHKSLLQNYPAYEKELKLFISSFPHENNMDMQYVKQHLQDLSTIDKKYKSLNNELEKIGGYVDRHNKKQVESKSKIILEQGKKNLIHSDISQVNDLINKSLNAINIMKTEFEKDEKIIISFYNELCSNTVDMWQEDVDCMCLKIKQIIDKKPCCTVYSMDEFIRNRNAAINKKRLDIQTIISGYHWLNRPRYQQLILNLSRTGVSYQVFVKGIQDIKSNRNIFVKLYENYFYK